MKRNTLPPLGGEHLRLSVDIREKHVALPRLAELEHALEARQRPKKQGTPKRSMFRLEVLRAIKSCGEFCAATIPELAMLAKCSVRECQYAIQDLLWLGWIEKLADVSAAGGAGGRGARKTGNLYRVTRPSWAWDGTHRKRLWTLANAGGVGVHSMHPIIQEALGLLEGQDVKPFNAFPQLEAGRGAQRAPLRGVHRPKTPLSLVLKGKKEEKGTRKATGKRVEWPKDGLGFLEAWKPTYKRGPFPDQAALDAYHEIRIGAGGAKAAEEIAKFYVATKDGWLERKGHPLAWLRKHWPTVQIAKPAQTRKTVKVAGGDLLSRLNTK